MPKTRQQIIRFVVIVTTPLEWTDKQNEAIIEKYDGPIETLKEQLPSMVKSFITEADVKVEVFED